MLQNLILAKAIDLIPDPIIAVDEQGRIVFTNEAHKNLTGWHLSEIKGQNYRLVYEILSDFNGEYNSIMFGECYEDYINDINNFIEDEEFKVKVINCFNWYFNEWIDNDNN